MQPIKQFVFTPFMTLFILCSGMASFYIISCSNEGRVDYALERDALLDQHRLDRQNHFNANAEAMVQNSAESFIYVGEGTINRNSIEDQLVSFKEYLNGATYKKWDDIEEPIIRISDDATLAWMITRLQVERSHSDSLGNTVTRNFVYAGIMTYKKVNGKWIREANVSTFKRE